MDKAERRGFWQGAASVTAFWITVDLLKPTFWLGMLIAAAMGVCAALLFTWIDHRHPLPDEAHDQ